MAKKSAASSAHEKQRRMRDALTRKVISRRLSRKQQAELSGLAKLNDVQIDTRDIPEVRDWSKAKRGLFYRPAKRQITLRIDADLLAWFRSHALNGKGYQTQMNRALREYVDAYEDTQD